MNADFPVILDACVLANQRVTDLLLRLAETPRLYLPYWSARILDETDRTLRDELGWPPDLVTYRREQIATHRDCGESDQGGNSTKFHQMFFVRWT